MSNYEYANGAGLSVLSQKIFEHLSADLNLKADKATTYTKTDVDNLVDTDVVTSEAANPLILETDAAQYAKNTHITLEPVQDLHGYDHPWPAGGGKNLIQLTKTLIKANNASGQWENNTATIKGITTTIIEDGDGNVTAISLSGTATDLYQFVLPPIVGSISENTELIVSAQNGSANGKYCYYVGYADATGVVALNDTQFKLSDISSAQKNLRFVVWSGTSVNIILYPMIRLASVSDATFVPYSNICPITGVDEVKVRATGKNLFDKDSVQDGRFDDNGNIMTPAEPWSYGYIKINGGSTYTVSGCHANSVPAHIWCDENKEFISRIGSHANGTHTAPSNASYIGICAIKMTNHDHDVDTIQVELGSTATDYEPYKGYTASLDLPDTAYSGTLDLETGELVCTFKKIPNLGAYAWAKDGNAGKFFLQNTFTDVKLPPNNTTKANMICSVYAVNTNEETYALVNDKTISLSSVSYYYFRIYDSKYASADAATFTTALSGVELCYELATPITYQLTPQQLALFKGINNISTNAKTVQVTYREGSLATLEELNAISFDLSNVKSKLPPIIIKNGMLQVTYDDGQ